MLDIKVTDTEKGFNVDFEASGTIDQIAQQLNAILKKIAEVNPQVIDAMDYFNKMDLHNEEN